ncbi:uncharacterized protein Tco025E_06119 [Trypanosoma conorhini]|uniref:Potassium channel tetramerisation-type BTB domain-containing protein n=1 Tax=Trypanosoma conorhini TaxID=83891 RepID=A0A3R7NXW5_9TRYP|nr:uncharacterized protein Tco025E_06119 [Trypanosoma conorhini]RNF13630.1 hypothetical protein Tco025E_06119 [Trypanosoma conorhini]
MNTRLYELPGLVGGEGLPLVLEDHPQPGSQGCACPAGHQMSVNEENKEVVNGGGDNKGADNGGVLIENLLSQYEHLQRSALAYMRTSHSAYLRLQLKRQRMEQQERALRRRAELVASASLSPTIKLNIGGMRFHVQRDTLLQFTLTVFHLLEDELFVVQRDAFGCLFLDRDPWLFRELLFLLRERRQRILEAGSVSAALSPGGVEYRRLAQLPPTEHKRLMDEARYYGLNELVRELTTTRFQWQQCELVPVSLSDCETGGSEHSGASSLRPPRGCCFATCVSLQEDVYLFGGCGEHEVVLNSFYRLHLEFDSTEDEHEEEAVVADNKAPPMRSQRLRYELIEPLSDGAGGNVSVPEPRSGHAMVLLQGRYLLLFYGNNLHSHLNDVWLYHLTRGIWVQLGVRGAFVEARSGHTVTEVNKRFFLIGGKRLFGANRCLFAEVFEGHLDISRMELTWSIVAAPQPTQSPLQQRQQQQGEGMSSLLHIGVTGATAAATTTTVDADGDNEEDSVCGTLPMAYHTAVEYKGRYVIVYGGIRALSGTQIGDDRGGEGRWNSMAAATASVRGAPPHVYQFDTLEFTWRRLRTSTDSPNLPWSDVPRSGHIALRQHDDMHVIGSYKEQRRLPIFALSLKTLTWRQIQTTVAPPHSTPCGRAMTTGVLLPPTAQNPYPMVLIYGGYDVMNRKYLDDAHVLTL